MSVGYRDPSQSSRLSVGGHRTRLRLGGFVLERDRRALARVLVDGGFFFHFQVHGVFLGFTVGNHDFWFLGGRGDFEPFFFAFRRRGFFDFRFQLGQELVLARVDVLDLDGDRGAAAGIEAFDQGAADFEGGAAGSSL